MGDNNPSAKNFTIDLGNLYTWMACDHSGYKSTSYHTIPCESTECSAYSGPDPTCLACSGNPGPSCNLETCGGYAYTPWSREPESSGLIEDVVYLYRQPKDASSKAEQYPLHAFPSGSSSKDRLEGMSGSAQGILTLANVDMALHSVISKTSKVPRKFAFCLPSTNTTLREGFQGALYIGGGLYYYSNKRPFWDVSRVLIKTPLMTNPKSTDPIHNEGDKSVEYFINVKSIQVGGATLEVDPSLLSIDKDGVGGTKLSTLQPYTVLHSSIYKALVDAFTATTKATRVEAISPFGACYDSTNISNRDSGPNVPDVTLFLEGMNSTRSVKWWIPTRNTMVKFSDRTVLCLGFVDGGSETTTSIIIGGKQMEDAFIEIDLESSTLGFMTLPLQWGLRCAQFQSNLPIVPEDQHVSLKSDV